MNQICFLRVDANKNIGYGHLSRCKIIAYELSKNNIKTVFLLHDTDANISNFLVQEGYNHLSLSLDSPSEIIACKQKYKAQKYLLILDTDKEIYYEKNAQLKLIDAGFKLAFLTFWDQYKYYSHIILNQNPISQTHHYKTAEYTKRLLGPEYMIFDDQFLSKENFDVVRSESDGLNIFISFGGSDEPDRTSKTIKALQELDIKIHECNVVIGALYKYEKQLNVLLEQSKFPYQVYKQIGNIADIMRNSNIAFCSGGLTLWELAILNIPTAIISFSERETITANYVNENEWTFHIGPIQHLSTNTLSERILDFINSNDLKKRTNKLKNIINIHGKKEIVREMISLLDD